MPDPDDLYGLPLDRFLAERAALAKALRSTHDYQQALDVAKLRRPTVAAWAVNQLVRSEPLAFAELYGAGDRLERVQSDLLAGRGDGHTVALASARETAAVDALVDTARGLLRAHGHQLTGTLAHVRDTLHAAALGGVARDQLKQGCLVRAPHSVASDDIAAPDPSPPEQEAAQRRTTQLLAARKVAADAHRAAARATSVLAEARGALAQARRRAHQVRLAQQRTQHTRPDPFSRPG